MPHARDPNKSSAHYSHKGGSDGQVTRAVPQLSLPKWLRSAATDYDERHRPEEPDVQVYRRTSSRGKGVEKVPCTRCGEPRTAVALENGICKNTRACDRFLKEDL